MSRRRNGPKADAIRIRTATRRERALVLRRGGQTLEQIGRELGVNRSTAKRLIDGAIASLPRQEAEQVRALLHERFEHVHAIASKELESGDADRRLEAARVVSRNAAAQSALHGLATRELLVRPAPPPSNDGALDLSKYAPDELVLLRGMLAKGRGEPTTFDLLTFARGVVRRADAALDLERVAATPAIAALPPRGGTGIIIDAHFEPDDDSPVELS